MPTASSNQTIISNSVAIIIKAILFLVGIVLRKMYSIKNANALNKAAAITKSKKLHFTSWVNCMAVKGIAKTHSTREAVINFLLSKMFIW